MINNHYKYLIIIFKYLDLKINKLDKYLEMFFLHLKILK